MDGEDRNQTLGLVPCSLSLHSLLKQPHDLMQPFLSDGRYTFFLAPQSQTQCSASSSAAWPLFAL